MCLIVFAWQTHPMYPLILAANRDEFYSRSTLQAALWVDKPNILGGRDNEANGTWMAVSKSRKIAAVTNFRDPSNIRTDAISRGELPVKFLEAEDDLSFKENLNSEAAHYNGYNLICFNGKNAFHFSNYENKINDLKPGIYGLSNALLDTPWPKVERAKRLFKKVISMDFEHPDLLMMMEDGTLADDQDLPETGVPFEWEKKLSAMCINTPNYGTCCSTVITLDRRGELKFTERLFPVGERKADIHTFTLETF